jgi:hypothetical protein
MTGGPSPWHIVFLAALQDKRPGEIYAGTAKGRHRKTDTPAARRRRAHREQVARRSATVRQGR